MNRYNLQYTIHFPGTSVGFMEFSPNGRFLIVGDGRRDRLYVLDRVTGFRPLVETGTISSPTSLAFENSTSFFVGLSDGRFVEYRVDLRSKYLVKGWTNDALHGSLPATAMTLDATARILALAVGPGVFVFNRVARTGQFEFAANVSSQFNFKREPGNHTPPFPQYMCFSSNSQLFIAFRRQNLVSVKPTFKRGFGLCAAFRAASVDYSGLTILKAIISSNEELSAGFGRFWIFGNLSQTGDDDSPFLFINAGAATLSDTLSGFASIKDVVTGRQIQALEHDGSLDRPLVMAYYVGKTHYTIATGSQGSDNTIKIWTSQKAQSFDKTRRLNSHMLWSWGIVAGLVIIIAVAFVLSEGNVFHSEDFRFNTDAVVRGRDRIVDYLAVVSKIAANMFFSFKEWSEDIRMRYFNSPVDFLV